PKEPAALAVHARNERTETDARGADHDAGFVARRSVDEREHVDHPHLHVGARAAEVWHERDVDTILSEVVAAPEEQQIRRQVGIALVLARRRPGPAVDLDAGNSAVGNPVLELAADRIANRLVA